MKIQKKILEETVNCQKNFSCLKDPKNCCEVTNCINKSVHFVAYSSKEYCGYRMTFGDADICNCPTRKEIYKEYAL